MKKEKIAFNTETMNGDVLTEFINGLIDERWKIVSITRISEFISVNQAQYLIIATRKHK